LAIAHRLRVGVVSWVSACPVGTIASIADDACYQGAIRKHDAMPANDGRYRPDDLALGEIPGVLQRTLPGLERTTARICGKTAPF
jgi:hypothetical protein